MNHIVAIAIAIGGAVIGCKGGGGKAADPGSGSAVAGSGAIETPPAPPITLTLPSAGASAPPAGARFVVITPAGLRLLPPGVDLPVEGTKLVVPDGETVTAAQLAALPATDHVVVIADAAAGAEAAVLPVVTAIAPRCWSLATAGVRVVHALAIDPCPVTPRDPDAGPPDLSMLVSGQVWRVLNAREAGIFEVRHAGALVAHLHGLKDAVPDRNDIALGVDRDATAAGVADAAAAAHLVGFTATRWLALADLPAVFRDVGAGSDGPRGVAPDLGPAPKVAIGAITGDLGGLTSEEVNRVVKARAGILLACYRRALETDAKLAGEIPVAIEVGASGSVTKVSATGALAKTWLGTCVTNHLHRLRFPAKGAATLAVTVTYAPS